TGVIPIVESQQNRRLVGIVTDRDLCVEVIAKGKNGNEVRLQECMTRNPVSCGPDDDLDDILKLMTENQIRRIPAVDSRNIVQGIVSLADVVLRGQTQTGQTRQTLSEISEPTAEASKPRAQSAGHKA